MPGRSALSGTILTLLSVAIGVVALPLPPTGILLFPLAGALLVLGVGVGFEGNRALLRTLGVLVGGVVFAGGIAVLWMARSWSGNSPSTPGVPGALAAIGVPLLFAGAAMIALVFFGTSATRAS